MANGGHNKMAAVELQVCGEKYVAISLSTDSLFSFTLLQGWFVGDLLQRYFADDLYCNSASLAIVESSRIVQFTFQLFEPK